MLKSPGSQPPLDPHEGYCYLSCDADNVCSLTSKAHLQVFQVKDGKRLVDCGNLWDRERKALLTLPDHTSYALVDSQLVKLDEKMNVVWRTPSFESWGRSAIAVGEDGTVAVETNYGIQFVSATGKSDGKVIMYGAGSFVAPVFLDKENVCFLTGELVSMRTTDRHLNWKLETDQTETGAGLVLHNGSLYACARHHLMRIDPEIGNVTWSTPIVDGFTPVVSDRAVVVSAIHAVFGLSPYSGDVGWVDNLSCVSGAVQCDSRTTVTMIVDHTNVKVALLDTMTGKLLAKSPDVAYIHDLGEYPLIAIGPNLFAGFYGGRIFAVEVK